MNIDKILKYFYKKIKISLFRIIYPNITNFIRAEQNKKIFIKKISFKKNFIYRLFSLPNGRLFSNSVHDTAVIFDDKIVRDVSYQYRYKKNVQIINGNIKKNTVVKNGTPRFLKKIKGNVFSLLCGGAAKNNYWHWIFDVLPKVGILEKSKIKFKLDFFLLPSLSKNYQKETFLKLGVPRNKLLNGEKFKHIICDNLIVTDHPIVFDNNPTKSIANIPLWVIKWLRKKFLEEKPINSKLSKKIFISRKNDSLQGNRKIVNNKELEKLLTAKGFKIITLSNFSFKKQVEIFKAADFIIGLHGAGFTNIVFSKPKTKILEIKTKATGEQYASLAKKCKLKYQKIIEKNISPTLRHQNSHIVVNLSKLKKMIS
jgi:hypothetical protein